MASGHCKRTRSRCAAFRSITSSDSRVPPPPNISRCHPEAGGARRGISHALTGYPRYAGVIENQDDVFLGLATILISQNSIGVIETPVERSALLPVATPTLARDDRARR